MDYDFYGIFIRMRLQKSKGIPATLIKNPDIDLPVESKHKELLDRIYKYLSSVTVDLGLGYQSKISVVINPPYEDGIKIIDSEMLDRGNVLYVQWGYSKESQRTDWYSGIILEQPDVSIDPNFSITINAKGWGYMAQRRLDIKTALKGTPQQIIRKIAVEKWKLDLDDEFASNEYRSGGTKGTWKVEPSKYGSDFNIVKEILAKSGNYFYVNGNKLTVISVKGYSSFRPKYTFRMFGELDVSKNIYPINSFSFNSGAMFLPRGVAKTITIGVDPKKKQIVKASRTSEPLPGSKVTDTTAGAKAPKGEANDPSAPKRIPVDLGRYGLSDVALTGDTSFGDKLIVGLEEGKNVDDETKGYYDLKVPYAEIEFDTVGIPGMGPRDLITVDGIGKRLSGQYMVFGAIHEVNEGGYNLHINGRTRWAFGAPVNNKSAKQDNKQTKEPITLR